MKKARRTVTAYRARDLQTRYDDRAGGSKTKDMDVQKKRSQSRGYGSTTESFKNKDQGWEVSERLRRNIVRIKRWKKRIMILAREGQREDCTSKVGT